jgi:hypothetical protein
MSEPITTSSQSAGANARGSRIPFVVTILVCLIAGLAIYLWGRGSPARRVNLAIVTWNNDPFWDAVIRGGQDAANEWNVNLTAIKSTPEVETQST